MSERTIRPLPSRPSLEWLRKLAKQRLKKLRVREAGAQLADAHLAVARELGFPSWRKLKAHVETVREATAVNLPHATRELMKAIVAKDVEAIGSVLAQAPQVINRPGPHPRWGGRPQPLHVAIETGDVAVFTALIEAGADVSGDNRSYDGWSPLMLAVHWNRPEMRYELIRRGAAVGLIEALMLGDNGRVEQTLRDEPDALKQPMPNDATPLHFAMTERAVDLLLRAGVSIDAKDKYGKPAAERLVKVLGTGAPAVRKVLEGQESAEIARLSAMAGDMRRLGRMVRKQPSLAQDPAVLHAAVDNGHVGAAKWLLDHGADPNARFPSGSRGTMLHAAAWSGNLEMVRLLVERGADPAAVDEEHKTTPALWAEHVLTNHGRESCREVIAYLRSRATWEQSSPKTTGPRKKQDWKPIMDAAYAGDAGKIRRLLNAGANPNVVSGTAHRYRPLHRAIEYKKTAPRGEQHLEAVKCLLEHGADPKLRGTHDQLTALQLAAIGDTQFIPLLRSHFGALDVFHAALLAEDKRVRELLKQDKSLASAKDVNDWTPLCYAAASRLHAGDPAAAKRLARIAQTLLDAGADPMVPYHWAGKWPLRPLWLACGRSNNVAVAEVLLKAGADPCDNESVYHASDEGHQACLDLIERHTDPKRLAEECTKCLRTQFHWRRTRGMAWLLAHGADPDAPDPETGDTALHNAARSGLSDEIMQALLDHGGSPSIRNKAGQTPADVARKAGKRRVIALLKEGKTAGRTTRR